MVGLRHDPTHNLPADVEQEAPPAATISAEGLADIASALANIFEIGANLKRFGRPYATTQGYKLQAAVATIREAIHAQEEAGGRRCHE